MAVERTVARQITVYAFERLCAVAGCGQWFEIRDSHPQRVYCSESCRRRMQNWRYRQRARVRESRATP